MAKIKVAVLFGGVSNEHDVSLVSASNVIDSIPRDKYEVICIGITKKGRWLYYPGSTEDIRNGKWELNTDCASAIISPDPIHKGIVIIENGETSTRKVDVVFPVLHGKNGEDGTVQGLLDMARIPYVGCGLLASAACMDKAHTHMVLDYHNIKTARWRMITHRNMNHLDKQYEEIAEELRFPLFVKPVNCGSSIGINKANDFEELDDAVKTAFSHGDKVIIEEFIKGRRSMRRYVMRMPRKRHNVRSCRRCLDAVSFCSEKRIRSPPFRYQCNIVGTACQSHGKKSTKSGKNRRKNSEERGIFDRYNK